MSIDFGCGCRFYPMPRRHFTQRVLGADDMEKPSWAGRGLEGKRSRGRLAQQPCRPLRLWSPLLKTPQAPGMCVDRSPIWHATPRPGGAGRGDPPTSCQFHRQRRILRLSRAGRPVGRLPLNRHNGACVRSRARSPASTSFSKGITRRKALFQLTSGSTTIHVSTSPPTAPSSELRWLPLSARDECHVLS